MRKLLIYMVPCLILVNCVTGNNVEKGGKCAKYENQFQDGLAHYYECTTHSTKDNFWFCKNCSGPFWYMYSGYEYLKTVVDTAVGHNNETCINELVNKDRMNIWFRLHAEAVKLWDDSNCYNCYDWNSTLIDNNTIPMVQKWSEEFTTFLIMTDHLETCEKTFKKTPCTNCLQNYTELNKFYEKIKKKAKTNICFDIENAMNRTRRYWSGNLGCCRDDEASFLVFSIMASIIGALPVLFYFSAYFMTKRAEDLSPVTDGETQITPNSSSINNHEAMPGTSIAGSSNASTAIVEDTPTTIRNNTQETALKNVNIKDIVKQSNFEVPTNNLRKQDNVNVQTQSRNPNENLINLERSDSEKLINLGSTPTNSDRSFI